MMHEEHLGPYLPGTDETELHPWIERLTTMHFEQVVGYRSEVRILRRRSGPPDASRPGRGGRSRSVARKATEEMIAANATPLLSVEPFCSPAWLERSLRPDSLILFGLRRIRRRNGCC